MKINKVLNYTLWWVANSFVKTYTDLILGYSEDGGTFYETFVTYQPNYTASHYRGLSVPVYCVRYDEIHILREE